MKFIKVYCGQDGIEAAISMDGKSARLLLYLLFKGEVEYESGKVEFSRETIKSTAAEFKIGVTTLYKMMAKLIQKGFVIRSTRGRYLFNKKYFQYG